MKNTKRIPGARRAWSNSLSALGVCAAFSGAGPALAGPSADPSGGGREEAQRTFTVNTDDGIAVVRINALGPGRAPTETPAASGSLMRLRRTASACFFRLYFSANGCCWQR